MAPRVGRGRARRRGAAGATERAPRRRAARACPRLSYAPPAYYTACRLFGGSALEAVGISLALALPISVLLTCCLFRKALRGVGVQAPGDAVDERLMHDPNAFNCGSPTPGAGL